MRIHVIRHVPFEGPELIAQWAHARDHELTETLALTEEFPELEEIDLLVLMGGPMGADDDARLPWLAAEKRYVSSALANGSRVLGVCLGSQIVAEVAGGAVRRNDHREIGWYPVHHVGGSDEGVLAAIPEGLIAGHWHGDTFSLPDGVEPALSSEACMNQAYAMDGGRIVGLQCHLEWTEDALDALVEACGDDLAGGGPYVMSASEMLEEARLRIPACRDALFDLLDRMMETAKG